MTANRASRDDVPKDLPELQDLQRARRKLLAWFRACQRPLPWRAHPSPYHVLVSEIMLQQTQVAAVVPYFERFVAAFPSVVDLARADESDVLRLWEGLGYYRRARSLHKSAQLMVDRHAGEVPRDPAALAALPGVGRYTLGAVLSQAYDLPFPVVDANVARVLCRWFSQAGDPKSPPVQRWLWDRAARLLPRRNVGTFNQALMELGALVCTPRSPKCSPCPLAQHCAARRLGLQDRLPTRQAGQRATAIAEVAVVPWRRGRVLLVRRPTDAQRWANLWEFPRGERREQEADRQAAARVLRELTGYEATDLEMLDVIRHGITRYVVTMHCWRAHVHGKIARLTAHQAHAWVLPSELGGYPLSAPQRRLANLLVGGNASLAPAANAARRQGE